MRLFSSTEELDTLCELAKGKLVAVANEKLTEAMKLERKGFIAIAEHARHRRTVDARHITLTETGKVHCLLLCP